MRIGVEWLGIGLMALVAFITRPLQTGSHWPQIGHSLYWAFSKPIFVTGMILTVLPSCLGIKHSFFNLILTAKCFVLIARISFCTYLVHILVIYYFLLDRVYDVYYTIPDVFVMNFGLLTISLFFGFILTMFVELPFANLLKIWMASFKQPEKMKAKEVK